MTAPQRQEGGAPPPDAPVGGEVRIGSGRPPAWLRWFNYAMYVAAVVYLAAVPPPDGHGYAYQLGAAGLLLAWLAYIYAGRRPPEP